jgi:asparagine synthase (glutamine-hydrolysing)
MCGIAGIVGSQVDDSRLATMAERMAHRGPDSQGVWHDATAGLAIRRLAIIDLDHRSDQPLHLGPWHLVFNGEIYNYRELREELRALGHSFVTDGDGEVLLHAWAEWEDAALDRVNGMFAVALWHDERKELVCARDPFGEKPLFWARLGDSLVFASEIRALLAANPVLGVVREDALAPYLGLGYMPTVERSFFAQIQQLPAAHLLRFRDGQAAVQRYWRPQPVGVPARYEDAASALRELLLDSIRLRLRSDVPVGTSLSGGIDSSAIVALAAQIAGDHRRHAFTARFPGFERDEWSYAQAVAHSAGVTQHHEVLPTADELLEDLSDVVAAQGEPFGSASIYAQWRVMRTAREAGITVLLDGQGADELFGGYPSAIGWALRAQGVGAAMRGLLSRAERPNLVFALEGGRIRAPMILVSAFRRRETAPYVSRDIREAVAHFPRLLTPAPGFRSPLAKELVRQTFHTSLPDLLRYADRNSMTHSREVRLPFLDRRVAEFALSLPAEFLYRDGVTKAVLREAARGIVPSEILARRDKVGFEPPEAVWFSRPAFLARISEVLLDGRALARGLYDRHEIEMDLRAGHWRSPRGIWRALNLELWLQALPA